MCKDLDNIPYEQKMEYYLLMVSVDKLVTYLSSLGYSTIRECVEMVSLDDRSEGLQSNRNFVTSDFDHPTTASLACHFTLGNSGYLPFPRIYGYIHRNVSRLQILQSLGLSRTRQGCFRRK